MSGPGLGGNNHVYGQDGIYPLGDCFRVTIDSGLNIKVGTGLALIGDKVYERGDTDAAADVAVPAALGAHYVYLNAATAVDANGDAIARVTVDTVEADQTRPAINGSTSDLFGRSFGIAKVTVTANTGTVTLAGTPADTETVTVTLNGHAVITTFDGTTSATLTSAAAAVAAALNADATFAAIATATSALGVVTITGKTGTAYTLTAAETMASGTATASGGTLTGGGVTAVDNGYRLTQNMPLRTKKANR